MTENFDDVLGFWFAPGMEGWWYIDDPNFDARIVNRFMTMYSARDGRLDTWRENARSLLALIIVLDQFPRNMFRCDARAFATDHLDRLHLSSFAPLSESSSELEVTVANMSFSRAVSNSRPQTASGPGRSRTSYRAFFGRIYSHYSSGPVFGHRGPLTLHCDS
jgi:Bacterial protein of unknown function (DUF924)